MKRITSIILTLCVTASLLCMGTISASAVTGDVTAAFSDPGFKAVVLQALGKSAGSSISAEECATITTIDASGRGIHHLGGLEHLVNLERLDCSDNKLTSLTLTNNTKLKYLDCSENKIRTLNFSNQRGMRELICSRNYLRNQRRISGLSTSRLAVFEYEPQNFSFLDFIWFGWVSWIVDWIFKR